MKRLCLTICLFALVSCGVSTALADNWQVVYQTDFSSDPGWITNNPSHYYWDSGLGAYYQREIDGTEEYAYKLLPGLQQGCRWRLEYDILPKGFDWAGDARLSFADADMDVTANPPTPSYIAINFPRVSGGYTAIVEWCDSEGNQGGAEMWEFHFQLRIWYSVLVDWNPDNSELYVGITERGNPTILAERTFDVPSSFSGIDRLAMSTIGDDYAPGATGISYIDNIIVSQQAPIQVHIDIKPGSCPNPLNVKNEEVLPVAILGTEDFDVLDIDVASIRLEGISPIRSRYEDAATPFEGEICECHELGADGYLDLTLKFTTQEIVDAIGDVNDGDEVILTISGKLSDGSDFAGADCVVIIKKGD